MEFNAQVTKLVKKYLMHRSIIEYMQNTQDFMCDLELFPKYGHKLYSGY